MKIFFTRLNTYFSTVIDVCNSVKRLGLKKSVLTILGIFFNRFFDFRYNLDTLPHYDQSIVGKKGIKVIKNNHCSRYDDSSLLALRGLFSLLDPDSEKVLLDVGCGKGIVLLAALDFNFKEIRGFDHSEYLCDVASRNCLKYQKKVGSDMNVTIINASALDYQFQDDENVLYFYNPFDAYLSEKFLDLVKDSLLRRKRKMWIIARNWAGKNLVSKKLEVKRGEQYTFWGRDFTVFTL